MLADISHKKSEVLIVDDIPSNLNFLSEVLHLEGISVLLATTGADAIEIARYKHPDLILLDIAMPMMDGYEVCEKLKNDPDIADIPVIYLTARTEPEDILKGFQTGAVDYILKPFNATELIARVKTHLELRAKTEALKTINVRLEEQVRQRTAEITEANRNLTDTNRKLELAYQELTNLDKAKDEFIRHINHELRTPLQGIHGFTLILEDIVESPEQKEYLQAINSLVKRLVKLSEISLLFTEIKAKNYKITLKPMSIKNSINQILEVFREERQRINVLHNFPDENFFIKADQRLMNTCLELVVDNALKYTPENGKVTIRTFHEETLAGVEIMDEGPGFTSKALESLYELFTADNLRYHSHGFGIGLATAKVILDTLSAKLDISNLPEKGAAVRMVFEV
ncbi:MAG TPA: hybrid sensor histidine kinase/response regulator [Bacteroidales bacterium]|nr:hybrid sensor histidine kinase/response regulator [Bacteroidales bacterium]